VNGIFTQIHDNPVERVVASIVIIVLIGLIMLWMRRST
jgi:hypothetical protein